LAPQKKFPIFKINFKSLTFFSELRQATTTLAVSLAKRAKKDVNKMTTEENVKQLKKLNRQINEIISELKKSCLEIKVKQHVSDKIELSVFKRII